MTGDLVALDPQEDLRRRLPAGWRIARWEIHSARVDHRVLDVQLLHVPTQTEFTIRCSEAPDWDWLVEMLVLSERTQDGVEISAAHGRWWF